MNPQIIITGLALLSGIIIALFSGFWKIIMSLRTIIEDIASLKAGSVGYVSQPQCNLIQKGIDNKITVVKTEILEEIGAVEYRLDKRISKLEDKK